MPILHLTKQVVEALPFPASGQQIYWDDKLKGFGLRVTPGSKVYIVQGRDASGKDCRSKIGDHGKYVPETARQEAKRLLSELSRGTNLNAEKVRDRARVVTLAEVYERYKASRALRASTVTLYESIMRRCFPDWQAKPINEITKDMIEKRHKKISNNNGVHGKGEAQANQAMRTLRSIYNFAISVYEDSDGKPVITENPVKRLSQVKAWNRNVRRQTYIQRHQLRPWFDAVENLGNSDMQDYLVLCMLTGLRRNEAAKLKWSNVDLKGRTIYIDIADSKTHEAHCLPLSDYLTELLTRRSREPRNAYVFPGGRNNDHLVESKSSVTKVVKESGIKFSPHDLRRTFLTVAESLDIPHYALKRLANHRDNSDVTSGYIVTAVDRLRAPMQQITDFILTEAGRR